MLINDPDGQAAHVTKSHQLETTSITKTQDRHENQDSGAVWSYCFDAVNPVAADDFFIYIKNTNSHDYVVTDFRLWSTTTGGNVMIHKVSGTPSYAAGGTDVAAIPRNTKFTSTPDLIFKTDTDITGLNDDGIWFPMTLDNVGHMEHLQTTAGIILGANGAMGLSWSAATGEISGLISIALIDET